MLYTYWTPLLVTTSGAANSILVFVVFCQTPLSELDFLRPNNFQTAALNDQMDVASCGLIDWFLSQFLQHKY